MTKNPDFVIVRHGFTMICFHVASVVEHLLGNLV
jgi:hypothetical protein